MILLIGGNGSIGRRYQSVLRSLDQPFLVYDYGSIIPEPARLKGLRFQKAIIACPTETHLEYCQQLLDLRKPFLCEKPLTKSSADLKSFIFEWEVTNLPAFVVNNWAFAGEGASRVGLKTLEYDFFHTGRDGLLWDVCQLVHLAKKHRAKLTVKTNSYFWDVKWNDKVLGYQAIEMSYRLMVKAFLEDRYDTLWDLKQGMEMIQTVEELIHLTKGEHLEGFTWDPGKNRFEAFARKDL